MRAFLAFALAAGVAAHAQASPQPPAASPWLGDLVEVHCENVPRLAELTSDQRARVRCGRLSVPLDYAAPEGRRITLAVAVRAAAHRTGDSPVLVLNGGSFGSLRTIVPSFSPPYPDTRDVVLIDPRGMDASALGICKDTTARKIAAMAGDLDGEALRQAYNAPLTACREEMRAAGVEPHVFGAAVMARDVEVLRRALGYRRLILIGQSLGSTIAPTYAALFPGRAEALVLDAPYPPDPTPKSLSASFREGLEGAAAWCRGRPVCGPAGDRLTEAYDAAFAALRRQPMHLQTQTLGPFVLNADDFNLIVQNLLYPGVMRAVQPDTTPHAIAPAMIAAVEAGDTALAGRIADQALRRLVNGPHSAVFASGECRDRPRYRRPQPEPFTGVELIDFTTVCSWWTDAAVAPVRLPPPGSTPTLVLAGTTDPITPVSFAEDMARRLGPSARVLTTPGGGHGNAISSTCARAATLAFLQSLRLELIPASCSPTP